MAARKPKLIADLIKEIPYSDEGEKGVLSSMMQDHDTCNQIITEVKAEDFFIPAHQIIFKEIVKEWKAGKPTDLILLTQKLTDKNLLLQVGGAGGVTSIYTTAPSPANYLYYIEIVKEKALARKLLDLCNKGVKDITSKPDEVKDILGLLQSDIFPLRPWQREQERTLKDDILEKLERMETGRPQHDVVRTGLAKLDHLSPVRKGDFPILSGVTKAGKSILALSILENICVNHDHTGIYFSLESPRVEVVDRLFAGVARVDMNKHYASLLNPDEIDRCRKASEKLGESKLIIHDDKFELSDIMATIKLQASRQEIAVVVVDYCQLIISPERKGGTRQEQVATISRSLRVLALELKIPIIMLSQLNEEGHSRESRAIEQDCTAKWVIEHEVEEGMRRISIPMQRNGLSGVSFPVSFLGSIARVEDHIEEPVDIKSNVV